MLHYPTKSHNLPPPEFAQIEAIMLENAEVTDVKRAAAFFKLIRYSYGSGCTSYGCQPFDIRKCFAAIWQASRRLANTVVERGKTAGFSESDFCKKFAHCCGAILQKYLMYFKKSQQKEGANFSQSAEDAIVRYCHRSFGEKTEIVRVVKPVKSGEQITADLIKTVEVGAYNLPQDIIKKADTALGKYASADLVAGDYIIATKIADAPAAENAYLYHLSGEKQAMSVSLKAFANGLSGKLQSGDVISVIAPDYKKQGATVIPEELQYVEVIAVTANSGYDANTAKQDEDGEKELPGTVTLLVTPEQSKILAELEADGRLHLSLVYRGDAENRAKFIKAQQDTLTKLYPSTAEKSNLPNAETQPKPTKTEASDSAESGVR